MTVKTAEAELSALLATLEPKARRQLAVSIARQLRQSQQKRIADQLNPDGTAFAPRKPTLRQKQGTIRRQMFSRLRTAKYLKTEASPDAAVVGFISKVGRIAAVHQYGLRDRVRPGGAEVQYPARRLLGFTATDYNAISDMVMSHLQD